LGLDIHAETIAIAIAEPDGEVRSLGTIPNRAESIRKLIKKAWPGREGSEALPDLVRTREAAKQDAGTTVTAEISAIPRNACKKPKHSSKPAEDQNAGSGWIVGNSETIPPTDPNLAS
jgi:hypothetical protein